MAITVQTTARLGRGWALNAYSTDFSGCETALAGVTGKSHCIESIHIASNTNAVVSIGEDDSGSAVTTVKWQAPIGGYAGLYSYKFRDPLKLAAGTAIAIDSSGAAVQSVYIEGYTE